MTINIQYVHLDTSESLNELIQSKLDALGSKYDWIINAQVFIKQENDPKGRNKICEMELSLPGPRIFASSKEESYESAVANTISDLNKKLEKRKHTFNKH